MVALLGGERVLQINIIWPLPWWVFQYFNLQILLNPARKVAKYIVEHKVNSYTACWSYSGTTYILKPMHYCILRYIQATMLSSCTYTPTRIEDSHLHVLHLIAPLLPHLLCWAPMGHSAPHCTCLEKKDPLSKVTTRNLLFIPTVGHRNLVVIVVHMVTNQSKYGKVTSNVETNNHETKYIIQYVQEVVLQVPMLNHIIGWQDSTNPATGSHVN